jgi:HEAT repeat protein
MQEYVQKLYTIIQSGNSNEEDKVKATLTFGEIGQNKDLSKMPDVLEVISKLFQHNNDQVRQAAAISLGILSIGNTNFFLQKVFKLIENSQDQQKYMFLSTVKEIIFIKPECLSQYLNVLMPLYLAQSKCKEEKDEPIRNIVAESIGKLFITHPDALSPYLEQSLKSADPSTVATYAKSFKYSAHNNNHPEKFQQFILILVDLIRNSDLAIKKNSLESLSQIVFNKHLKVLLNDKVDTLIGITLLETPIKQELIV